MRVAIIGGGVSGLAAAYYAQKHGLDYTLFEVTARLGGVIRTERVDDFLVEAGPDSFLTNKPWAADLARELGIGDQLIYSSDHERKTYIVVNGRLREMPVGMQLMAPTNLWSAATSPLFSWQTKLRIAREHLLPAAALADHEDESVASFTERHFGREMVERVADPLLAGVYGGDSSRLSARAVIPAFVEAERKYGSVGRGLRLARRSTVQQPIFTSFRLGMQQLVEAIAEKLDRDRIKTEAPVSKLTLQHSQWQFASAVGNGAYTHVIAAVPAYVLVDLLREQRDLSTLLRQIAYASSITVSLVDVEGVSLPPGFGFLVPRSEGGSIIACTFVHGKFADRAPKGKKMLRAFLTVADGRSDTEVVSTVAEDLRAILGSAPRSVAQRVYRWPKSMPQYEVGHLERVAEIDRLASQLPGLRLIGNAYRGIGVSDCIREAELAVAALVAVQRETINDARA